MPAAPKAILFDLDDTLLDRARTFEKYFARFAARYRDQLQDCDADELRRNILEADGVGYRPRAEMAGMLLESLPWRKEPSVEQLVAAYREDFLRCAHLSDGAFELLDYLRSRGIKTGVITNGESEVQRRKIEQLGLTQWMDVIVVSAEFGTKKPDAAIFRIALRQLGVDASEAWFVGDHPDFDVTAAEAIGMTAFWIARMTQWPANKPRCARQIESLLDLLRMLTDQPG